jgi:hypothetical protein
LETDFFRYISGILVLVGNGFIDLATALPGLTPGSAAKALGATGFLLGGW